MKHCVAIKLRKVQLKIIKILAVPEKARAKAIGRHDSLYESCAKEEHERENQYSVLPTLKHPPREHKHAIYRE